MALRIDEKADGFTRNKQYQIVKIHSNSKNYYRRIIGLTHIMAIAEITNSEIGAALKVAFIGFLLIGGISRQVNL